MVLRGLQEAFEDRGARGEVMNRVGNKQRDGETRLLAMGMPSDEEFFLRSYAAPFFYARARSSVDGMCVYIYVRMDKQECRGRIGWNKGWDRIPMGGTGEGGF